MKQEGLPSRHGILIIAELRQPVPDEGRKCGFCIARGDWPGEALATTEMCAEAGSDQRHDIARNLIRGKARRGGWCHALRQGSAVFGIIIPSTAGGFIAFHQKPGCAAHFAVEKLHPVLLAPHGPGTKTRQVADEAMIGADFDRQAKGFFPSLHILQHAPFAGMGCDNTLRPMPRHRTRHFAREALRIRRIIQADVIHRHATGFQGTGEMAHGRQDQDDFLQVMGHIGAFAHHLHQQDLIALGVETLQSGKSGR